MLLLLLGESQWDRPILRKLRALRALGTAKALRGSAKNASSSWKEPTAFAPDAAAVAAEVAKEHDDAERLEQEKIAMRRAQSVGTMPTPNTESLTKHGGDDAAHGRADHTAEALPPSTTTESGVQQRASTTDTTQIAAASQLQDEPQSPTDVNAHKLRVGSHCHALFYSGEKWFPGKIVEMSVAKKAGQTDTFTVLYDTGDRETGVPRDRLHTDAEHEEFERLRKEEAAWRHGFKRSAWVCKRNSEWDADNPTVSLCRTLWQC